MTVGQGQHPHTHLYGFHVPSPATFNSSLGKQSPETLWLTARSSLSLASGFRHKQVLLLEALSPEVNWQLFILAPPGWLCIIGFTRYLFQPNFLSFYFCHFPLLLLSRFSRVQLCATPIHGSPPGSTAPGILQAKTREWVAISFAMHESEK